MTPKKQIDLEQSIFDLASDLPDTEYIFDESDFSIIMSDIDLEKEIAKITQTIEKEIFDLLNEPLDLEILTIEEIESILNEPLDLTIFDDTY